MATSAAFFQASISDACNNMSHANLRVGGRGRDRPRNTEVRIPSNSSV